MPASLDIVFSRPRYAGGPLDLVFGGGGAEPPALPLTSEFNVSLGGPAVGLTALYDNRLPWRVSARTQVRHQSAAPAESARTAEWSKPDPLDRHAAGRWQSATDADASPRARWQTTHPTQAQADERWTPAQPISVLNRAVYQACTPMELLTAIGWAPARPIDQVRLARHQVATPAALHPLVTFAQAVNADQVRLARHQVGTTAMVRLLARWQPGRPLPAGLSVYVPPGGGEGVGRLVDLNILFACPPYEQGAPADLVFGHVCIPTVPEVPGTTIVPVRSVYMTVNNFSLFRVDTSQLVPADGLSLSLDVDSWTWNCSFSVRGDALSTIERNSSGDPVILQVSINSTPIRVIVEKISRERSFGSSQLRVQGRGIAAELDSPFAPILSFGNSNARTARQLLDDILTFNGASIGWNFDTTDFTDWLVPAGVFSHTGTYISALNAVAGSIGAYVQPHNTDRQLNVLLRYPTPAWGWSTAIPDLVLPSAVTSTEGIEWLDKPEYNRVFVHGQEGGRVGRYTRQGTAGDSLAPAVVDPLITHADASRQRGRAIISDTGRIANVTLRLPVLAETGIIKPGQLVEYTDGPVSRIGMSRSVAVDVSLPTIYQTIQVETHVD